ncbi:radial spoke head 10 homolog B isoform X4 [Oncorhynchus kisutch]|uniref:Radial spoke head 10 homolog B n=1 Tax=Oncorhynchus kisutch TaxID=8019 RepID=A0A8C7D1B3_ONCKI|nr:radial spoke head 10 homolog B isoform X4 [Oncorhynchus kisutch]
MAKGDKKKKPEKTTPEQSLSTFLSNDSHAGVVSEPHVLDEESGHETDVMTASFSSQPPLADKQLEISDDAFHEVPVLPNIIVQRYEGEKHREQLHGEGVAYFQGGHVYKGMFSVGVMHGHGLYTWADGVKYEGEFAFNVPMGHGTYTWLDGSCYEGEVCSGIRHGVGTYRCANSSVIYRGQWHHSKRHGKGTIYYNQEATSWYEGELVNNNREGWGVRCYPSGNLYEGQWRNNVRHGEGRMRWLQLGQQYSGIWENGVQHGQGTHTWFLRRVTGSQYPLRNEYTGDFVQGLRHGQGSFYYASGALYKGEWKDNRKHGQGKFIFKNGRIFEGEFVDDHMAEFPAFCLDGSNTPDLSGIRTHTPHPEDGESPRRAPGGDSGSGPALLGPDMALDITALLENLPENQRDLQLKQVEFVVLRHIAELRAIYSFYSSLGHDQSPDNTFLLSRLQLWRLLKDCSIHQQGITLAQVDRYICAEDVPSEEIHSPFSTMLLRRFLSCVVVLAYNTYHKDIEPSDTILVACLSKLMRENIIPNAKNVKGLLFPNPMHAVIAVNYIGRCWEIYKAFCRANPTPLADQTMTVRHFIWMFKDLSLFDAELTTGKLLEILSVENPAAYDRYYCNLDLEMTFLEFFEALLGCAEVSDQRDGQTSSDSQMESCPLADTRRVSPGERTRDSPLQRSSQRHSPLTGPTAKSSNPNISPDVGSVKSLEMGKSKEILQLSTPEEMEPRQSPNAAGNLTSQTGGGGSATHSSDTERREGSGGARSAVEAKVSNHPPHDHPPSTEPVEDRSGAGMTSCPAETELDSWVQRTHQFFTQRFFPAYEYSLELMREVQEERLRQAALARIALAKAKEDARLREQWEAEEEERRREEEEDEEAERVEGPEDDLNPSPAAQTPVASTTSVVITKQSPATAVKKKRK